MFYILKSIVSVIKLYTGFSNYGVLAWASYCALSAAYLKAILVKLVFWWCFTATNGHSECLRLLIGNAEPQNAVDIQDGNGQ